MQMNEWHDRASMLRIAAALMRDPMKEAYILRLADTYDGFGDLEDDMIKEAKRDHDREGEALARPR